MQLKATRIIRGVNGGPDIIEADCTCNQDNKVEEDPKPKHWTYGLSDHDFYEMYKTC
jgi:hypothetical protein